MLCRQEGVVEPLVRQSVGELAGIANQDDTVVEGIVDFDGDVGSLGLQVGTAHLVEHLAERLRRSGVVAESLHVVRLIGEAVVIPLLVLLRDVDDDGVIGRLRAILLHTQQSVFRLRVEVFPHAAVGTVGTHQIVAGHLAARLERHDDLSLLLLDGG